MPARWKTPERLRRSEYQQQKFVCNMLGFLPPWRWVNSAQVLGITSFGVVPLPWQQCCRDQRVLKETTDNSDPEASGGCWSFSIPHPWEQRWVLRAGKSWRPYQTLPNPCSSITRLWPQPQDPTSNAEQTWICTCDNSHKNVHFLSMLITVLMKHHKNVKKNKSSFLK